MLKYLIIIFSILINFSFSLELKPYKILSNFSTYSEYVKSEFKKSFKKLLARPQGLWIYPLQNKIYVADTLKNRLVSYSLKDLKYINEFANNQILIYPYDVSKIAKYQFLIGVKDIPYNKILWIDMKNERIKTLLKSSQKILTFDKYIFSSSDGKVYKVKNGDLYFVGKIKPQFIDVYVTNNFIYVLYPLYKINIYNKNFKLLRTINIKPYTYLPSCIGVKGKYIYIGDKFLGEIIVINTKGKYINEFGGKGYKDFAINEPVKIRIYKNYLYLLDMGNNHVDIFKIIY